MAAAVAAAGLHFSNLSHHHHLPFGGAFAAHPAFSSSLTSTVPTSSTTSGNTPFKICRVTNNNNNTFPSWSSTNGNKQIRSVGS